MKLLGILPLVLLVTPAAAQSFNIDVGDNLVIISPLPSPTYGGQASQPGTWTSSKFPYSTALLNLDGSASTATTTCDQHSSFNQFPSTLTGEDHNLMIDIQTFGSAQIPATATWTFAGLLDGEYTIYTYAWSPGNGGQQTLITVPGSITAPQLVGGSWSGSPHAFGVTYARHNVHVSNGSFTLLASSQNGAGSINGFQLVFGGPPFTAFCSGDGSGTQCPCGNAGAPGLGCASSVNSFGGRLAAGGMSSLVSDSLTLIGSGMPDSSALFFQGTAQLAGGAGVPFGDGLRCVGGTIVRLGTLTNMGGASVYPGPGNPSVSMKGNITLPGTRHYQVWYRNAASFCTPSTFNLTNGLLVVWS